MDPDRRESLRTEILGRLAGEVSVPAPMLIRDISRGGAKIKISDQRLKQYIPKSKGFIFDIVFKLQAPREAGNLQPDLRFNTARRLTSPGAQP